MGKDLAYCINTGPSCRLEVERALGPHMRLGSCEVDLGSPMRREMVFHDADWRKLSELFSGELIFFFFFFFFRDHDAGLVGPLLKFQKHKERVRAKRRRLSALDLH